MTVEIENLGNLDGSWWIVTAGETDDLFEQVNRLAVTLNSDIERNKCLPSDQLAAWKLWFKNWKAQYAEHKERGWFTKSLSATYYTGDRWHKELLAWRDIYKSTCRRKPSGEEPPEDKDLADMLADLLSLVKWIAIPVVAFYGFKIAKDAGLLEKAKGLKLARRKR
jgi:hypothetical protein